MFQFKYEQLFQILLADIDAGVYAEGEALPSERNLAERYQVSRVSVRAVIRLLERQGRVYRVPGRGNFVGHAMATVNPGRSRSHLIAFTALGHARAPHTYDIAVGIRQVVEPKGYHLIVTSVADNCEIERQALHNLLLKNVDGLVITPAMEGDQNNRAFYEQLAHRSVPFVLIDRPIASEQWANVVVDSGSGMLAGVKALVEQGHRRIAYVGPAHYPVARARIQGYQRALTEAGLPIDPDLIFSAEPRHEMPFDPFSYGQKGATHLRDRGAEFTAIACFSDAVAYGAWMRLKQLGWEPGENRCIVGFDCLPISDVGFQRHLITFRRPARLAGELAAQALIGGIEGGASQRGTSAVITPRMHWPDPDPLALARDAMLLVTETSPFPEMAI